MKLKSNRITGIICTLVISTTSTCTFAQDAENLVSNGGFESIEKKPKKLGSIESAMGWVSPTGVRADLFSDDKIADIAVPENIYGKEDPKEGENYVGIVAYSSGGKIPRSYIMSKLNVPLKKGMKYCVKFHVSLAEGSKYACNNLGAVFSNKPFGTDGKVPIIEEPDVVHFKNETPGFGFTARYGWTEVCAMFEAEGGEKYISIGNFVNDGETAPQTMKKDKESKAALIAAAYYYIDDISVMLVDTEKGEKCDCAAQNAGEEEYSRTIYQKSFNITEEMSAKEKIEIQEIYFAFGRNKLASEGEVSLKMIAELLKADPSMKIEIIGHNNEDEDKVGMENDYYADMDNKRIAVVMQYLIDQGIEESRMMYTQKGSEEHNSAITEEDSEDLRLAKDRRVTFKIR